MPQFLNNKVLNSLLVRTENNALQYESTGTKCLDLFSHIGSFRDKFRKRILQLMDQEIIMRFENKLGKADDFYDIDSEDQ